MGFFVYKVEDNLDSYFWNSKNWVNNIDQRKLYKTKSEAEKIAKKEKGKVFPSREFIISPQCKERNIIPYQSVEEWKNFALKRYRLERIDCAYLGSSRELEFEVFKL